MSIALVSVKTRTDVLNLDFSEYLKPPNNDILPTCLIEYCDIVRGIYTNQMQYTY